MLSSTQYEFIPNPDLPLFLIPQLLPLPSFPMSSQSATKSQDRPGHFAALVSPRILFWWLQSAKGQSQEGLLSNYPFLHCLELFTAQSYTKAAGWEDDSARWKAVLLFLCVLGSTSSRISTSIATQGIFKGIFLSQPCATTWLPEKPRRAPKHNISQGVTVRAVVIWN